MSNLVVKAESLNAQFVAWLDQFLERGWLWKGVLIALLISVLTSAPNPPAIFNPPFPQYLDKFENPFYDIVKDADIPEATQAANTNFRLGIPILFNLLNLHYPKALTYLLIISVVLSIGVFGLICRQIFEDRKLGFLGMLYIGCTYNGSFSYPSVTYDQFTLLLIFLTMVRFRATWLVGLPLFLALWCDERAYPGGMAALGLHLLWASSRFEGGRPSFQGVFAGFKDAAVLSILIAYVSAYTLRLWVGWYYDFSIPVGLGAVLNALVMNIRYFHIGLYTLFEGGWLIVIIGIAALFMQGNRWLGGLVIVAGIPLCMMGFTVFDISRTFSYIFPSILVAFFLLAKCVARPYQLPLLALVALISLVSGNYVIHSHREGMLRWVRPLPVMLVEDQLMKMREEYLEQKELEEAN